MSIDKTVNKEGHTLLNRIEERGWIILNGSFGNEGGWTYYVRKRKEYREQCKEQKKKHEEEEEEEKRIRNIKSEAEAWKYINKYRKKKTERISEKINIEEWKDHFVELLDDTQEKAVRQIESEEREDNKKGKEEIEDITREELIETLKKLKKAKAPGGQNRE